MPLLVLSPNPHPNSIRLARSAEAAGWEVTRLQGYRAPPWLSGRDDIALYGEPQFALEAAGSLGVCLLAPTPRWVADLPERFRRRDVRVSDMAEARRLTGPAFVRSAIDKSFPSRVIASGAELPPTERVPDGTPVMIAETVAWQVEYRCFVRERRIETMSIYLRDGAIARDAQGDWPAPEAESVDAKRFAESVLAAHDVAMPGAVVIDVGIIKDRGWAVVEANAAWSSGLYGCDLAAVLRVVQRASVKPSRASAEDAAWVAEM